MSLRSINQRVFWQKYLLATCWIVLLPALEGCKKARVDPAGLTPDKTNGDSAAGCTRNVPSVEASTQTLNVFAGGTSSQILSIQNNDTIDCGASNFTVAATVTGNLGVDLNPKSILLNPGQKLTTTVTLITPSNAIPSSASLELTATSSAALGKKGSVTEKISVFNPLSSAWPTLSPGPSGSASPSPSSGFVVRSGTQMPGLGAVGDFGLYLSSCPPCTVANSNQCNLMDAATFDRCNQNYVSLMMILTGF